MCVSVGACVYCECVNNFTHVSGDLRGWIPSTVESYSFFPPVNRKQRNRFLKFCLGTQNVNFMQLALQS